MLGENTNLEALDSEKQASEVDISASLEDCRRKSHGADDIQEG